MISMQADIPNLSGVIAQMTTQWPDKAGKAVQALVKRLGIFVQKEAMRRAPISPTQAQYNAGLVRGPTDRTQRMMPGGLSIRSIKMETSGSGAGSNAEVFVASNAPAGKYAGFINNGTYNLGPGSLAKNASQGGVVGPHYMERAATENNDKIDAMLADSIAQLTAGQT